MKLATRTSLFFLAALAIVLAGFSGSIYWLARSHLFNQLHELTQAALDTLNVAVESGPQGLEWDTKERHLAIDHPDGGSLLWTVFDETGQRIDGAEGPIVSLLQRHNSRSGNTQQSEDATWTGERWRITRREVRAEEQHNDDTADANRPEQEPDAKRYSSLTIAVGTPLTYITKQLRILGLTLVGLSVLIWLSAAFLGRWLCRNALAPLTHMAQSIATMSVPDLNQRLPSVSTGDELEDLSRAFNELLDRLQVSFDRQRRFAAEASHQLRTPLTAMLGHVDVALRRDRSSDEYRQTLHAMKEQATRLRRIVEMLLFLTREDSEAASPQFEGIELNNWLANHLSSWQQNPRYQDLHIELETDGQLWINAHDGLLGEVFDNLLDNACKYSAPKSPITVRTVRSEGGAKLVVQDSGHGIPQSELARVVDPFFRSADVQRRGIGGSGLGLSIVNRIVGAFGAKLSVESCVGRGSVFTITFQSPADKELQCA